MGCMNCVRSACLFVSSFVCSFVCCMFSLLVAFVSVLNLFRLFFLSSLVLVNVCLIQSVTPMFIQSFVCVLKCVIVTFAVGPMVGPQLTLLPADEGKEWQRIPTNPCGRYLHAQQTNSLLILPTFLDKIFPKKYLVLQNYL